MNFGIIGFGRFGQLLASALLPFGRVIVYDNKINFHQTSKKLLYATSVEDVMQCNFLFLLVPISAFEQCCQLIQPLLSCNTVVVDCCSVKIYPIRIMENILPKKQSRIALHPLFGPDSVKISGGIAGHQLVVCPTYCEENQYEKLMSIFKAMQLKIMITTAEEHDQQMAMSQGLVHFLGRGLDALKLKPCLFATPGFQSLLKIKQAVMNDKVQLFMDMHRYNPYTNAVRENLLKQLRTLNHNINLKDSV